MCLRRVYEYPCLDIDWEVWKMRDDTLQMFSSPRSFECELIILGRTSALGRVCVYAGQGEGRGGGLAAEYVILSLFLCFQYLALVLNNITAQKQKKTLTIITQILTTLAGLFLPCSGLWPKIPGRSFIDRLFIYSLYFPVPLSTSPCRPLLPCLPLSLSPFPPLIYRLFITNHLSFTFVMYFFILNNCAVKCSFRIPLETSKRLCDIWKKSTKNSP